MRLHAKTGRTGATALLASRMVRPRGAMRNRNGASRRGRFRLAMIAAAEGRRPALAVRDLANAAGGRIVHLRNAPGPGRATHVRCRPNSHPDPTARRAAMAPLGRRHRVRTLRAALEARARSTAGTDDRDSFHHDVPWSTVSPVIIHVVLFRPRADLGSADATLLIEAFNHALTSIPSVRSSRVGRRTKLGTQYEQLPQPDLTYVALIEFDDRAGLAAYLEHPAHTEIGRRFFEASETQLIYDFDTEGVIEGAARSAVKEP